MPPFWGAGCWCPCPVFKDGGFAFSRHIPRAVQRGEVTSSALDSPVPHGEITCICGEERHLSSSSNLTKHPLWVPAGSQGQGKGRSSKKQNEFLLCASRSPTEGGGGFLANGEPESS